MQDEEFDNIDELIRAASESYHPAYDDKAWEKMEVLLDKHLPQKANRRKPIIFFLLLLFIGIATSFAILFPWNKKESNAGAKRETKPEATLLQSKPAKVQPGKAGVKAKGHASSKDLTAEFLQGSGENNNRRNFKKASPIERLITKRGNIKISASNAVNDFTAANDITIKSARVLPHRDDQVANKDETSLPASSINERKDKSDNTNIRTAKNDSANGVKAITVVTKATASASEPAANKPVVKNKPKKGLANNFAITLSAGPELSFVGLGGTGKTRLDYGAGLSYTFAKRLTVRSGFYIAKKLYTAKPADYHPPVGYWTYYANMQRIDADCKVYEIPFTASYNFKQSKNHNWFAGIGLSSFLIKKETYYYFYKNMQGQNMYKAWSLSNKNKHYFSVLTISGGYQYRINQHFSLLAEPYFKLPLKGIGFGKIKLNSGGVLLTASIKPFAKKK